MAASELQKVLLGVSISLFDAAPGATYLQYFEDLYTHLNDDVLAVAERLTTDTVFLGLYPESLSNIDFASAYVERLVGSEADAAAKAWAVRWISGQMDLGASRATVMLQAADILNTLSPTDPIWGNAQQALANKIAAAAYYSVETGQSANDIKVLQAVIAVTTSDAATIPSTPLQLLIADHALAITTRDAFLISAAGDDGTASRTTHALLETALAEAFAAVDVLVAGEYASQTAVIKAALLEDQQAVNSELETFYQAAALAAAPPVDAITGLTAAVAIDQTQQAANEAAQSTLVTTNTALLNALATFGTYNNSAPLVNADGSITGLIEHNGGALVLATDITEVTHPGIDTLLVATTAKAAANAQRLVTALSATAARDVVENLDLSVAATLALASLGAQFTQATPADVAAPSLAEIDKEVIDLRTVTTDATALIDIYIAASALATTADANTTNGASTDDLTAIQAAFRAAVGVLPADTARVDATTTDALALDEILTLIDEKSAVVDAAQTAETYFDNAKSTYDDAADTNPLVDALIKAQGQAIAATQAVVDLAAVVALQEAAQANVDTLTSLNGGIESAAQRFTDIGLGVPEVVEGAATGTPANDTWLAGNSNATIGDFAAKDTLYFDIPYALNTSTTAGANSADSLREMWIVKEGGSSVFTLESTMTGGNNTPPATFSITLTGVALADIQLVDGFVTLI